MHYHQSRGGEEKWIKQMEMVNLDMLVLENHNYCKFADVFDFGRIGYRLNKLEKKIGRNDNSLTNKIIMNKRLISYEFIVDKTI